MKSVLFLTLLGSLIGWLAIQAGLGLMLTILLTALGMLLSIGFALAAIQEFEVPDVSEQ
jgi:hypothetical protein